MNVRTWLFWVLAVGCAGGGTPGGTTPSAAVGAPHGQGVAFSEWSAEALARAREEDKPILLSVQAGWCHWCHVMNDTTYRDPAVVAELEARFVVIRADGDARPDLAERYRRWGWPATIFLTPDGERILAVRGYRDAARFRAILGEVGAAHREGRTLEESVGASATNEDLEAVRASVRAQLDAMYDEEAGGWGHTQRYPFAAPVEHALFRATVRGEGVWRARAMRTLAQYARLIDPVWGGVYQYSVGGVWDRPHFEKIVPVQAGAIIAFAEAYRASGDGRWLAHAEAVRGYVTSMLRAEDGAFYASQDADLGGHGQPGPHVAGPEYYALDDAGRRALGVPRVDTHVYASTNGMLIEALARLHLASGRRAPLAEASRAMERIERTHRDAASGLYAHDAGSGDAGAADPLFYLADQAYVLRALIALHQASAQARWLAEAGRLARAMVGRLGAEGGGFYAHTEDPRAVGFFAERRVPIEENAVAARGLLMLARLLHDEGEEGGLREVATRALRATARPAELRSLGRMVGEYLLALEELEAGFVVLSVVGPDEPRTQRLYEAARAFDDPTRLVELGRPGASRYPYPGEPAVFLCTNRACSMPVFEPDQLELSARAFLSR